VWRRWEDCIRCRVAHVADRCAGQGVRPERQDHLRSTYIDHEGNQYNVVARDEIAAVLIDKGYEVVFIQDPLPYGPQRFDQTRELTGSPLQYTRAPSAFLEVVAGTRQWTVRRESTEEQTVATLRDAAGNPLLHVTQPVRHVEETVDGLCLAYASLFVDLGGGAVPGTGLTPLYHKTLQQEDACTVTGIVRQALDGIPSRSGDQGAGGGGGGS
jgi:hypothetical protein